MGTLIDWTISNLRVELTVSKASADPGMRGDIWVGNIVNWRDPQKIEN